MTVLRCTAKLLKRLRQPERPPEPEPDGNPLGEWYADLDIWRRQPFVVMLNAATGAVLVLPGDAATLRKLEASARRQLEVIGRKFKLDGAAFEAELQGFDIGVIYGRTRDRSLLSSLNNRKLGVWMGLEHGDAPLETIAAREWEGLFAHPSLGRHPLGGAYHRPLDLLRARLLPSAAIIPIASTGR